MVNLILKFVSCCRASGLRVSTSEVLDCTTQLQFIDVIDESQFRAALRANFAKSRREQGKFDQLYDLFFHELHLDANLSQMDSLSEKIEDVLEMLHDSADQDQLLKSILDFLAGEPLPFLGELRRIQTEHEDVPKKMRFNLGPLASSLEIMIRINNTRNTIFQFLEEDPLQFSRENRRYLSAHFNERLDGALRLLMHGSRPDNDGLKRVKSYEKHLKQLGERSFSSLTPREVEEMRDVIEQLVRKLKDIVGLRYATMNRGGLDVKKTLRRAAKYQGIPIEIKYRNRPPRKAKIVTLCDVSSSVWSAARFMLNILYSLQECFTKVRSFVFVSGLADVTETFENYEINKAIEKVLKDADIEYHVSTDYGETFRHFRAEYMDALNKKTTLIIIGDGRSNYFNPEEAILEEMRDKCRRIIWLNPDPENVWYTGDSEMRTYETYCHELRPCRNLNQLIGFIEDLIL